MKENRLKAGLARGEMLIGCWLNLGSAAAAEMAGGAGFDWALIDGEHAPYDVTAIQAQLRALAAFEISPVVRVPVGRDWLIKQVLDLGVESLLVPMVEDADQAAALVRATRYPPEGVRGVGAAVARATGYGADGEYIAQVNEQICLIVQAESLRALENLEAIAATPGVDAVFIGPSDLAADMGFAGRPDAPEVQAAITDAIGRIRAVGKAPGLLDFTPERFAGYREMGVGFLAVAADVTLLRGAMQAVARQARAVARPGMPATT